MLLKISQVKVVKTILDRLRVTRFKVAEFEHKEQPGSFFTSSKPESKIELLHIAGDLCLLATLHWSCLQRNPHGLHWKIITTRAYRVVHF